MNLLQMCTASFYLRWKKYDNSKRIRRMLLFVSHFLSFNVLYCVYMFDEYVGFFSLFWLGQYFRFPSSKINGNHHGFFLWRFCFSNIISTFIESVCVGKYFENSVQVKLRLVEETQTVVMWLSFLILSTASIFALCFNVLFVEIILWNFVSSKN